MFLTALRDITCGPWTLLFAEDDGAVRHIRFEGYEVLRGIYAAVRDANWDTIPPRLTEIRVQEGTGSLTLTFHADCQHGEVAFAWEGEIRLERSGTLTYRFVGWAGGDFRRNRIGFCVLHSPDCAGLACRIETVDGIRRAGAFPESIAPHQPFMNVRALSHEPAAGLAVEVRMEGDTFETEDQRNWTDASFKTYCTPLNLPFPVAVVRGAEVHQSVTVRAHRRPGFQPAAVTGDMVTIRLCETAAPQPWPRIGFGATAEELRPLQASELARLRALHPSHLRIEIVPGEPDLARRLTRALTEANGLAAGLEIALRLDARWQETLATAEAWTKTIEPARIVRWILTTSSPAIDMATVLQRARVHLPLGLSGASLVGGTDAYFAELNRRRPPLDDCDAVSFSINPQVHAGDDLSLVETLPMQGVVVRAAQAFCAGRPVLVSPVTLRPRYNPNATGAAFTPADALPLSVDSRQRTLFGALWTLGSVKHLSEAGAAAVTYYETKGWKGLMEDHAGSLHPTLFPSLPGEVFPVWSVFHAIAEFAPTHVVPVGESDPLRVVALLLAREGRRRLLVANVWPQPLRCQLPFAPAGGSRTLLGPDERLAFRGPDLVELPPTSLTQFDLWAS